MDLSVRYYFFSSFILLLFFSSFPSIQETTASIHPQLVKLHKKAQHFNNTKITPEFLVEYSQNNLPGSLKKSIQKFLKKKKKLINCLTQHLKKPANEMQQKGNKYLRKTKLKNLSNDNFVFQIPSTSYICKITGPRRKSKILQARASSYTCTDSKCGYNKKPLEEKVLYFSDIKTLHSFTRMAYFLKISEVQKNVLCKKHLCIPKTFLFQLPWRKKKYCDCTYIIIQEYLPSLKRLSIHNIELLKNCFSENLYAIFKYTGLWDLMGKRCPINLFISTDKDNKPRLALSDFEEASEVGPDYFFNQEIDLYFHKVFTGISRTIQFLYYAEEYVKLGLFIKHFKNDEDLKQYPQYSDIYKKIAQYIKHIKKEHKKMEKCLTIIDSKSNEKAH